jgi:hypothetical protein
VELCPALGAENIAELTNRKLVPQAPLGLVTETKQIEGR